MKQNDNSGIFSPSMGLTLRAAKAVQIVYPDDLSCAFIQQSRTESKPWLFSQLLVIPVWVAKVFDRCQ